MEYYIKHTDEALEIIKNAHHYTEQFKIKKREDLISLLVLEKLFYKTGRKKSSENLKFIFFTLVTGSGWDSKKQIRDLGSPQRYLKQFHVIICLKKIIMKKA